MVGYWDICDLIIPPPIMKVFHNYEVFVLRLRMREDGQVWGFPKQIEAFEVGQPLCKMHTTHGSATRRHDVCG